MLDTPESIGPYRILDVLGEGGMGIVYAAEQRVPVRRRVALKVIKVGMDTKEVLARFEAERQALAMLDHPNVARVLEAGATEAGRPYFAMEIVRGLPIHRYCDQNRLTIAQRVELVLQACAGLHHAHERGIVHRDVKPSNLLVADVEGMPQLKVIDFGLAKATNQRLTERTVFTEEGRIIGTPEYMSPEQAEMSGLDVDQRTDVFSIGVVLYELLAGVLPFEPRHLRDKGYLEIQRIIREEDPPTPSKRLSAASSSLTEILAMRRCRPQELRSALRGGLEVATMTAMAKSRNERYGSCRDLAEDLRCFLNGEALRHAKGRGATTAMRRVRRFARRHAIGLTGAIASVAVGLGVWVINAGGDAGSARYRDMLRERDQRIRELSGKVADLMAESERTQGQDATPMAPAPSVVRTRAAVVIAKRAGVAATHLDQAHFVATPEGVVTLGLDTKWCAWLDGLVVDAVGVVVPVEPGGVTPLQAAAIKVLLQNLTREGLAQPDQMRSLDEGEVATIVNSFKADHAAGLERQARGATARFFDFPRDGWSAAAPNSSQLEPMPVVSRLTVHHSAMYFRSDDLTATCGQLQLVQKDHMSNRGYGDIGYHFVIDVVGRVFEGRSLRFVGAHASGNNNDENIGICLLGNFVRGKQGQEPTLLQLDRLERLLEELRTAYAIGPDACYCHSDFKAVDCPGPLLSEWMVKYREKARKTVK